MHLRRICIGDLGGLRAEDPQPALPNRLPGVLLQNSLPNSINYRTSILSPSCLLICAPSGASHNVGDSTDCGLPAVLSIQALGELTLFMPTAAAAKGDGDWGAWAPAWLDAWSLIAHCDFWDRHWMALFSRLAKHDTRSAQPPPTYTTSPLGFYACGMRRGCTRPRFIASCVLAALASATATTSMLCQAQMRCRQDA